MVDIDETPMSNDVHACFNGLLSLLISGVNAVRGESLHIRIGMNTGPVVAGIIGTTKFSYDLWFSVKDFQGLTRIFQIGNHILIL